MRMKNGIRMFHEKLRPVILYLHRQSDLNYNPVLPRIKLHFYYIFLSY